MAVHLFTQRVYNNAKKSPKDSYTDDIIILLNFIFTDLHDYRFKHQQTKKLPFVVKDGDTCCTNLSLSNFQFWQNIEGLENKIYAAVKKNLEEILEVKTFLKKFIRLKCQVPKAELRFCSFLGCVHFSIAGTD